MWYTSFVYFVVWTLLLHEKQTLKQVRKYYYNTRSIANMETTIIKFTFSALPWIMIGLSIALYAAKLRRKRKNSAITEFQRTAGTVTNDVSKNTPRGADEDISETESYSMDGMMFGMCIGCAFSASVGWDLGLGMAIGMLIGFSIGFTIPKRD